MTRASGLNPLIVLDYPQHVGEIVVPGDAERRNAGRRRRAVQLHALRVALPENGGFQQSTVANPSVLRRRHAGVKRSTTLFATLISGAWLLEQ